MAMGWAMALGLPWAKRWVLVQGWPWAMLLAWAWALVWVLGLGWVQVR